VWLWTSVLRAEFERLSPQAGELVAIRYEGRVEARDGRPAYEKHRVIVDRDGAGPLDWGAPADEPTPAAEHPRHPATPPDGALRCEQYGHVEPEHAVGCPAELPF